MASTWFGAGPTQGASGAAAAGMTQFACARPKQLVALLSEIPPRGAPGKTQMPGAGRAGRRPGTDRCSRMENSRAGRDRQRPDGAGWDRSVRSRPISRLGSLRPIAQAIGSCRVRGEWATVLRLRPEAGRLSRARLRYGQQLPPRVIRRGTPVLKAGPKETAVEHGLDRAFEPPMAVTVEARMRIPSRRWRGHHGELFP